MSKKDLLINVSPFFLLIAFFILGLLESAEGNVMLIIRLVLLLGLPLVVSIYNTVTSSDCSDILLKNTFFTFSCVVSIVLAALISERIQYDPEMEPVMWLFVGLAVAYMGVLTLICCIIKRVVKKKD